MTSLFPAELMPALKWVVPTAASVLVVLSAVAAARGSRSLERVALGALLALSLVSVGDYTANHVRTGRYFNYYELFHYYVGTKYAREVGYSGMYEAALVAEADNGGTHLPKRARDLASGRHVRADRVRERGDEVRARFTPERWDELRQDIHFFRSLAPRKAWHGMVMDKGYNASPVWTMVSGTLANAVPTTSPWGMQLLALLDVFLLLGAFGVVWWAFGLRAALLAALVLTTHYVTSHNHQKAAFLRTDWIVCLVASVALLKKGWFKTAGALTAYAALLRVFPAIFLFGVGVKLLDVLLRERRVDRRYGSFVVAFALTAVVFTAASVAHLGVDYWREFIDKIRFHNDSITAWRIGFKYVFLLGWDGTTPSGGDLSQAFERLKPLWWAIQLAVLGGSFLIVRRLPAYEAHAYGFVVFFFLVAPTYYYYIALLLPAVWLASRPRDPLATAGLVFLFASSVAGNLGHATWDRSYPQFFMLSCVMLVFVGLLVVLAARERKVSRALDDDEAP